MPDFFLSPANDFHGRIGDLPAAIEEIQSDDWRVTCSPHHNHQDTAEYEVATQLWFDQHLQGTFQVPMTPETTLKLDTTDGVPVVTVKPDTSKQVLAVDVFYTLQGQENETPQDRLDTMHRFWHYAPTTKVTDGWTAKLPLSTTDHPLWVFANVRYSLDSPVTGAGYYYGIYTADSFNLSSLLTVATPEQLDSAGCKVTLKPSTLIEDFSGDWEKEWFSYRRDEWAKSTNKLNDPAWHAPPGASLAFEIQADEANKLVVLLDDHAAEISIQGGQPWQKVVLKPSDFQNYDGDGLSNWEGIRHLKLSPAEHLRGSRRSSDKPRLFGAHWKGQAPVFRNLRWQVAQ